MLLEIFSCHLSTIRQHCTQLANISQSPRGSVSPEPAPSCHTTTHLGLDIGEVLGLFDIFRSSLVELRDDDRAILREVLGVAELHVFPRVLSDLAAPFAALKRVASSVKSGKRSFSVVPVELFTPIWEQAVLSGWPQQLDELRRLSDQVEIARLLKFKRTIASLSNATAAPVTSSTAGQSDSKTTIQSTDSNNIASIPAQPAAKAMPRLRVARQDGQHVIVLDGKPYLVSHSAWRLFEAMISACPQFIHASKLNPSVRPDEVDKTLPKTLRKMAANESVNSTKAIWMSGKAVGCRLLINPNDPEKHAPT